MAITANPLYTPNSIYRPNIFIAGQASANPLVLCKAEVYADAQLITTISKAPFLDFAGTYYFEIDVAKVLQTIRAPLSNTLTSVFGGAAGALNIPVNTTNNDCYAEYFISVTYFYRDPTTGILTDLGVTDTSGNYEGIIATRQTRDDMDLSGYVMTAGFIPFLTNRPVIQGGTVQYFDICEDENQNITFIPYLSNAFEVTTYDSAGAQIDQGLATITPPGDMHPVTIGVGIPNLAAQVYFDGAVTLPNPNVAFYTVRVGYATFAGSWFFGGRSTVAYFNVVECCERRAFRVHFLNRLGGAEAYTFTSKLTKEETNKSTTAQKPQSYNFVIPPTTTYDRGSFKIQGSTFAEYKVESAYYDEADGNWIAEILSSPETYLETSAGLIAVIIKDATITKSETDELIKLELTITEANEISVQQF